MIQNRKQCFFVSSWTRGHQYTCGKLLGSLKSAPINGDCQHKHQLETLEWASPGYWGTGREILKYITHASAAYNSMNLFIPNVFQKTCKNIYINKLFFFYWFPNWDGTGSWIIPPGKSGHFFLVRSIVKTGWWEIISKDQPCNHLRVQEQSTNMTSQYQYPAFAWRSRSGVVTSQC